MIKQISIHKAKKYIKQNKVTLVSGSFDLLHIGHIKFLQSAKDASKDSKLVVILLSDMQIKRRKGNDRPFIHEEDRLASLSALESVDKVVLWTKPWEELRLLVEEVKPNMLAIVKGDPGEDNKRKLVEDYGGKVYSIKKYKDYSTSKLIKELKSKQE